MHLYRTGREPELARRLTRAVKCGRNVVRVFARCVNLFALNHEQPGYWEALEKCVALCNASGAYVNLVIGVDMNGMDRGQRDAFFTAVFQRYGKHPGVLLSLANEPYQNGFEGALDPALLAYADQLYALCGHRDFIIGDAQDGDDPDASADTIRDSKEISKHCNIIVLHNSRKGGASPEPNRVRRWIDHLEGFFDVMAEVRKTNPGATPYHEEAMGHASQQWVPLPNGKRYEREYDPELALAAALTAEFIGAGYCYHYISEQDDGTPGLELIGLATRDLPADPRWQYRNDSWQGSATRGFVVDGGKVRCFVDTQGQDGRVLAYGRSVTSVEWANGYQPVTGLGIDLPKCKVWRVRKPA